MAVLLKMYNLVLCWTGMCVRLWSFLDLWIVFWLVLTFHIISSSFSSPLCIALFLLVLSFESCFTAVLALFSSQEQMSAVAGNVDKPVRFSCIVIFLHLRPVLLGHIVWQHPYQIALLFALSGSPCCLKWVTHCGRQYDALESKTFVWISYLKCYRALFICSL